LTTKTILAIVIKQKNTSARERGFDDDIHIIRFDRPDDEN